MQSELEQSKTNSLYSKIAEILEQSRSIVAATVNTAMVKTYYEIGRLIVEDEQKGKARAEYGKEILKNLSAKLTAQYGKGFSVENLDRMRFFYKTYANSSTVLTNFNLSWSHYLYLKILNLQKRQLSEVFE